MEKKIARENLFLLEFLVDHVTLSPFCDCAAPGGEKCVEFQILDNEPLYICESDFLTQGKKSSKSSKSSNNKKPKGCYFSINGHRAEYSLERFDIYVTVYKRMVLGWKPQRAEVGMAVISISKIFCDLICDMASIKCRGTPSPVKTMKFEGNLEKLNGNFAGTIGIGIRLSCVNKNCYDKI